MAKQDWSTKKSELFTTFAAAVNKQYDDKFDLNDEQVNLQFEELYDYLPEEWVDSLETHPEETVAEYLKTTQEAQYAKKGAKLRYMQKLKPRVKKKCKCGCEMEDGGKVCKCCGGGTLIKHAQGGKVVKDKKETDNSEHWREEDRGTGNNSMNPNDWIKSKEEMDFIKKVNNERRVAKLKPKEPKKINTEIVPLKPKGKKDYIKGVKFEACGGKVKKKLVKKG